MPTIFVVSSTTPLSEDLSKNASPAQHRPGNHHNRAGQQRYVTSIEGTPTGLGGNLFIIDDPIKLGDAFSEVVRARGIEWYRSTLVTRPDDKNAARIVVVMQSVSISKTRSGICKNRGGLEVLNLPAIAQRNDCYSTGPPQ